MSEMIERVARTVATEWGDDFDLAFANKAAWLESQGSKGGHWRDITEPTQADFMEVARAVILSMREPTAQMKGAVFERYAPSFPGAPEIADGWVKASVENWRAMIDEALK